MAKSEKLAVIGTGGKQYRVQEGDVISIELLDAQQGDDVTFDNVLLLKDGKKTQVGSPNVSGATVKGRVVERKKSDKVIVFKKKKRKGYKRTRGHRQNLLVVEIEKISSKAASGSKSKSSAGAEKK